jgi:hypothetical protein
MYDDGDGCLTVIAVAAIALLFSWFLIIIFGGTSATPNGYTDVGNHISYKCDHGSILWYDGYNHRQLNTTLDDGRCHATP